MSYVPPEEIHRPAIRKALRLLGVAIQKESGASRVLITVKYDIKDKTDKLQIRMQVSTDNLMERRDSNPPKPVGDNLTSQAEQSVRDALKRRPNKGDKHV